MSHLVNRFIRKLNFYFSALLSFLIKDLRSSWYRARLWALLNKVKTLTVERASKTDIEVSSLVSHKDMPLYLAMMKTFFYFSKRKFFITVFDDGSLTKEDIKILNSFIKGVKIIRVKEANKKMKYFLKGKSYCQRFRKENIHVKKHLDLPLLACKRRILILDSDLLFFKKPKAIMDYIDKREKGKTIFINEERVAYSLSKIEAKHVFNLGLINNFNSGLVGFDKNIVDLSLADNLLKFIFDNPGRLLKMQTFYALILFKKRKKDLIRLPKKYLVGKEEKKSVNLICRHYISFKNIRNLFYDEALLLLAKIIKEENR